MTPREFIELDPVPSDECVAYGTDVMNAAEFYLPAAAWHEMWVLAVHGGFWHNLRTRTHMSRLCRALTREGIGCCSISYRRVGDKGGGWPGTFDDVLAAADFLHWREGSFVAVGFSAGGHLVLRLAAEREWLKGVVALAPVADLTGARARDLGEGAVGNFVARERMDEADPMAHPPRVPTIVVHGSEDDIVPVELSRGYARSVGVEMVELAGANHLDLINPESGAWPAVREAIMRSWQLTRRAPHRP